MAHHKPESVLVKGRLKATMAVSSWPNAGEFQREGCLGRAIVPDEVHPTRAAPRTFPGNLCKESARTEAQRRGELQHRFKHFGRGRRRKL